MLMKKSRSLNLKSFRLFSVSAVILLTSTAAFAQAPPAGADEDMTLWYVLIFALAAMLIGAIYWRYKSSQVQVIEENSGKRKNDEAVNADSELAWLRRNGKKIDKNQDYKKFAKKGGKNLRRKKALKISVDFDESFFAPLPVFTFKELKVPAGFDSLPISNDPELMNAIEQVQDELEEDEKSREIFLEVLTEFKNQNAVEAISDVALYDLSATLRSKALSILADFDHETVFEAILLACADPTREVRAAAARALFRVNFNRADAWARIALSDENGKMVQMARAAIEGDLVKRSFERLVHKDAKYAYEAFALLYLLIKSGETDVIFEALKNHPDMNVKTAILHTIKTTKDEGALKKLDSILEDQSIKPEIQKEIDKTIEEVGFVAA